MSKMSMTVTKEQQKLIWDIAERATRELLGIEFIRTSLDLTALTANGTPLRLEELLNADSENFVHDIIGISSHINRRTGKLEDLFVPRFAVQGE